MIKYKTIKNLKDYIDAVECYILTETDVVDKLKKLSSTHHAVVLGLYKYYYNHKDSINNCGNNISCLLNTLHITK